MSEIQMNPMETAPLDGREVLLQVELRAGVPGKFLVGHYMEGGNCIEDHPPIAQGWYFWNGVMFDTASKPVGWLPLPDSKEPFQSRVKPWILECFGSEIANDKQERNHRFLEESLEAVQSLGCTIGEAYQLVDYVFNRPVGEPKQEIGGVMVTLAALCLANDIDMFKEGWTELHRINTPSVIEKIRAKQATKPKHSPLPGIPDQSSIRGNTRVFTPTDELGLVWKSVDSNNQPKASTKEDYDRMRTDLKGDE